jgi:hypothetical protein
LTQSSLWVFADLDVSEAAIRSSRSHDASARLTAERIRSREAGSSATELLMNFHSSRRGSEQLGYGEWASRVFAQTKQCPLMKSGVICYLFSDPIRFLEGLFFIRKLYLSNNNTRQLAFVNIDSPREPSMRDFVTRFLDTPVPADNIEHR